MRQRVSLSLTGSHVYLHGTQERIAIENGQRRQAVSEAIELACSHMPRARLGVQVELGLDLARVAVMTVDQAGGIFSLPAARYESVVHAWAADMLHLAVDEQIIRWRALRDPRKVLVSCVNRDVAEELNDACRNAKLELASCRPAVMLALQAREEVPAETTVIWTEDGATAQRHGVVQLLHLRANEPAAIWRGWLPEGVEAMVSRFQSEVSAAQTSPRTSIHWPQSC